jgi:hypothetical protein
MITESDTKSQEPDQVRDLVQRFRVCWEESPERALVDREMRNVGFSLQIYGTHEPGTEHIAPGCERCRRVQSALKKIADEILPRERRLSRYEVKVDLHSLSYTHEREDRPDVRLTIQILHRGPWDQPVDECETRCVKEMEHALNELGACKNVWRTV